MAKRREAHGGGNQTARAGSLFKGPRSGLFWLRIAVHDFWTLAALVDAQRIKLAYAQGPARLEAEVENTKRQLRLLLDRQEKCRHQDQKVKGNVVSMLISLREGKDNEAGFAYYDRECDKVIKAEQGENIRQREADNVWTEVDEPEKKPEPKRSVGGEDLGFAAAFDEAPSSVAAEDEQYEANLMVEASGTNDANARVERLINEAAERGRKMDETMTEVRKLMARKLID